MSGRKRAADGKFLPREVEEAQGKVKPPQQERDMAKSILAERAKTTAC